MIEDAPLLSRALQTAVSAHEGQHRKKAYDGVTDPYVVHPLRVMGRVHAWGLSHDEHTLAAAVLHDVVEDTTLGTADVERAFGPRVATLVDALTHPHGLAPRERTRIILDKLADAPLEAVVIKLADRLDNVLDMPEWRARSRRGFLRESVDIAACARARLRDAGEGAAARALARAISEYEPVVRQYLEDAERDVAVESAQGGGSRR